MAQVITLPAVEEGAPVALALGKRKSGRAGGGMETAFGACLADSLIPLDLGRSHGVRMASGEGTWTQAAFTVPGCPLYRASNASSNEGTLIAPAVSPSILEEDGGLPLRPIVEMEGGVCDAAFPPTEGSGWKTLDAGEKSAGAVAAKMSAQRLATSAPSESRSISATGEGYLPDEKAEISNSESRESWGRTLSEPGGMKPVPEPMRVPEPSVTEAKPGYPREHRAVDGMRLIKEDFVSAQKGAGALPRDDAGSGKHPVEEQEKVAGDMGAARPGSARVDAPEARSSIQARGPVCAKEGDDKSCGTEGRFHASTEARASGPNPAKTEDRAHVQPPRAWIRVAELGERVVVTAKTLNRGDAVKAQLKLVPESLGKLDLEVEWNGRLTVRLTAHSEAAFEAIQRELPQLREALMAAGMDLEGLHLGMEGGGGAREEATARRGASSSRPDSQGAIAAVPASRPLHEGILDIEA